METRQLEYFVAAAEELNFTRAAKRLFAVQSTVSAGIRSLERELGAALLTRSTKHVALTPTGEALLPEARDALEAVERVRNAATDTRAGIRGRLRVGIFSNLEALDLPQLFGEFRLLYPLVELQLAASPSGSTGLSDDVRRGRVDVAFMGLPREDLAGFAILDLAESPLVVVLPEGHLLAGRRRLRAEELTHDKFVDSPAGFGNRVVVERLYARLGLTRRIVTEVADLTNMPRFVAAHLGIAIMPHIMAMPTPGTVTVAFEPPTNWLFSAISRPNPSPAVAALLALLAERLPLDQ